MNKITDKQRLDFLESVKDNIFYDEGFWTIGGYYSSFSGRKSLLKLVDEIIRFKRSHKHCSCIK